MLIALSTWSCLMLGLFKLHGQHETQRGTFTVGQMGGRFLLQKDSRYANAETTSTTTDRIPYDVLVDNRAGECAIAIALQTYCPKQ